MSNNEIQFEHRVLDTDTYKYKCIEIIYICDKMYKKDCYHMMINSK